MVYIPGGSFMMGSPTQEKYRQDVESPQHQVILTYFYMSKCPINQAQWKAVMGNNPSRFQGKNRPVDNISWNDAVKFCQRLSELTGKLYRLPSEAEWEYACRANTTTPFCFGETITTNLANYYGEKTYALEPKGVYLEETSEVDYFPPNAFGLYDMHGNVWEWCADTWHNSYLNAPLDGSAWKDEGNKRLLRGGSWGDSPSYCRAASRRAHLPEYQNNYSGFRVVLSVWDL